MTIEQIGIGAAPGDNTGDGLRTAMTKVNNNFSNSSHAASKLTGTAPEEIPLNSDLGTAAVKDTGTATGQVLLSEAAGLNSGALNLTSDNLNNNISDGVGSRIWAVNISGASIPVDTVIAGSGLRPAFANSSGVVLGGTPLTGTYRNVSNIFLDVNEASTFVKVS